MDYNTEISGNDHIIEVEHHGLNFQLQTQEDFLLLRFTKDV